MHEPDGEGGSRASWFMPGCPDGGLPPPPSLVGLEAATARAGRGQGRSVTSPKVTPSAGAPQRGAEAEQHYGASRAGRVAVDGCFVTSAATAGPPGPA